MAYKQTPGRSPFKKTGRDIPLNFLSPLHNEGEHKHPHENGISKDDDPFASISQGETTVVNETPEEVYQSHVQLKKDQRNNPTEDYSKLIKASESKLSDLGFNTRTGKFGN